MQKQLIVRGVFSLLVALMVVSDAASAQGPSGTLFLTEANAELVQLSEARIEQLNQLLERLIRYSQSPLAKVCPIGEIKVCLDWYAAIEEDWAVSDSGSLIRLQAAGAVDKISQRLNAGDSLELNLFQLYLDRWVDGIDQAVVSAQQRFVIIKGSDFIPLTESPSYAAIISRVELLKAGVLAEFNFLNQYVENTRGAVRKN